MITRADLERLYRDLNRRKWVSPDPLQFLFDYPDVRDREIVGLIASSLAYGRVAQILKSVQAVLEPMGRSPHDFLLQESPRRLTSLYSGFKHRFTTGAELVHLLTRTRMLIETYGSLNAFFVSGGTDGTMVSRMEQLSAALESGYLVPSPSGGSACKRLCLYLRWMVRQDDVDPGGWTGVSAAGLIVPLDTHMAKIARAQKFSGRKTADLKMALEITEAFRRFAPDDPVKYDFCLTRFGIRADMDIRDLTERG